MTNQSPGHVPLGRSGLRVPRLCLGTVNFGGRVDGLAATQLLDEALDMGVDFIDTADIYGWRVYRGYTEELLGGWLAKPGVRDRVILATKVGNRIGAGPNEAGLSAHHIVRACEDSLRRLQTDHIDLYQMHRPDSTATWDETWQAMDLLIAQGKVRYVGSSNFAGWQIASAQEAAQSRSSLGLVSEQCLYNPFVRYAELEVIPAACHYGVGVLVWSPLHGGLLSGVLDKQKSGRAVKSAQGRAAVALESDRTRRQIEQFESICKKYDRPPHEVALGWILEQPEVTSVVTGPRDPHQLRGALAALHCPLDREIVAELEELFPPVSQGAERRGPEAWIT